MNRRVVLCRSSVKSAGRAWQGSADKNGKTRETRTIGGRLAGQREARRSPMNGSDTNGATPRIELATLSRRPTRDNHWASQSITKYTYVKPDNTKGKKPSRCWGGMVGKIQEDG